MSSNAAELYQRIEADPLYRRALFHQALQNPQGALKSISEIGVSPDIEINEESEEFRIKTKS